MSASDKQEQVGAIILCGGQSTRMGCDKAWLPFGPETLLQRVVRTIAASIPASRIVVVAACGQVLPMLPAEVTRVDDASARRGPLEGLRVGLNHLAGQADPVFVASCDIPLLVPAVIELLLDRLGEADAAVPWDDVSGHPLTAVYRTRIRATLAARLAADQLRLQSLLADLTVTRIPTESLREVDPTLGSLLNINSPEDYQRARAAAGLPPQDPAGENTPSPRG